uniref:Dynamin gtpase n=1 Tax=Triatoma infestans TaxID=30076 RepID=A0A170WPP5_TRIIF
MDLMMQVSEKLKCVCTLTNCDQFELPSVIVIGEPNSGKSSLIGSLVGHAFLPIGPNNVTRCPVEINVVKKTKRRHPRLGSISEYTGLPNYRF